MSKYEHPFVEHADYLEYVVHGSVRDEDLLADLLQSMVEATEKTGKRRVLVDRTDSGDEAITDTMVIYRLAVRVGEAFGSSVRIAALSARADQHSFWEDVASNRGAIVKAGNDRESLMQWLLSDE